MRYTTITCLIAAVAFAAAPTFADLIAEDQFIIGGGDYTASANIVGQSSASSTGFSGGWTDINSSIFRPETAGLTYGNGADIVGQLASAGGSLQIDTTPYNDTQREVSHSFNAYPTSSTYFFSALMSVPSDSDGESYLQLRDAAGNDTSVSFGFDSNQAVLRLNSTSTAVPLTEFVAGQSMLFVMRVDVDAVGADDRVSLWVNPTQYSSQYAAGPAKVVQTVDVWDNSSTATQIRTVNRNLQSAGISAYDEVHFATTWQDAVPLAIANEVHVGFQEDVLPTGTYTHVGGELREKNTGSGYATDINIRVGNLEANSGVGDMRTVLGFNVSYLSADDVVTEATLRMVVDSTQGSNLGTLELHALLPGDGGETMIESQLNWNKRTSGVAWTTPGGDIDPTVLASVNIGNPSSLASGDVITFESSAALVALVQAALDNNTPLELIIIAPDAEAGATNSFIRWRSDDFGSTTDQLISRPLLSVSVLVPTPAALPAGLMLLTFCVARRRRC